MKMTRREILMDGSLLCLSAMLGCKNYKDEFSINEKEFEVITGRHAPYKPYFSDARPVVSIVKISGKSADTKNIEYAVTKAIDLIGGMGTITKSRERILIKPNLVNSRLSDTTKIPVVETLANLMKKAGKNVCIGEASAAGAANVDTSLLFNVCRTKNHQMLDAIQKDVFTSLGYDELAKKLKVPLLNLHLGKMVKLDTPENFVFNTLYVHEDMYNSDMICSVPMMKTHSLARVTLSLKNIGIGGFPGMVYKTVRSLVHSEAARFESTGTSTPIIDMVRANKIGLAVIDGSTAMQGQGPSVTQGGTLVPMNLVIASTNPLAADMVAVNAMGFGTDEIDTFKWAFKAGMKPSGIDDIEIVGEKIDSVRKNFKRPTVIPWPILKYFWGPACKVTA
jgi:uncharacterized protein (DUF362 family)